MVDIGPALLGLKYLHDFTKWVGDMRKDADTLGRINDAMGKVGEVQDKLQELRAENLALLEANQQLKAQISGAEQWQARLAPYKLVEAPGGAHVLRAEGPPAHYVCPSCAEHKKEIHPLQSLRVHSGEYQCPSCEKRYPVDKVKGPGFDGPLPPAESEYF